MKKQIAYGLIAGVIALAGTAFAPSEAQAKDNKQQLNQLAMQMYMQNQANQNNYNQQLLAQQQYYGNPNNPNWYANNPGQNIANPYGTSQATNWNGNPYFNNGTNWNQGRNWKKRIRNNVRNMGACNTGFNNVGFNRNFNNGYYNNGYFNNGIGRSAVGQILNRIF